MGKKQQAKGRRGEEELSAILQQYGYQARRGGSLTFGTVPDVTGLPGIHIEVKRQEALNLLGAIHQAVVDADRFQDGLPAVFHRKNRGVWIVSMRIEDWLALYRKGAGNL